MARQNRDLVKCEEIILDFFKDIDSVRVLEIIIDIYDEIRYSEMDKEAAKQKYLKVLYNLKESDSLYSLLEEGDKETLNLFLGDFLKIRGDGENFYIGNQRLASLTLDEFYNILIETKYFKKRTVINKKQLSIWIDSCLNFV